MRRVLLLIVFIQCMVAATTAQNCLQYEVLMQNARTFWKSGEYDKALKQLTAAREHCPAKGAEIDAQFIAFTKQIADKYKEAEKQTKRANSEAAAADLATRVADSTARANRRDALRAYANDLAYKSEIALRDTLRTEAFRLAEFAHRYVDPDNINVTRALMNALYYNDFPAHKPLNWYFLLQGHNDQVTCFAFSPDSKMIVTGSQDNSVKIWNLDSGTAILTLQGHTAAIAGVAFSPDGKWVATWAYDYTLIVWEVNGGKKVRIIDDGSEISTPTNLIFSPDGKKIAMMSGNKSASVWDLDNGKMIFQFDGREERDNIVQFSHDGKRMRDTRREYYRQQDVWILGFSQDSKKFITSPEYEDGIAKEWDLSTGIAAVIPKLQTLKPGKNYSISGDRHYRAEISGDNVKIWDLKSGKEAHKLKESQSSFIGIAISPDGKRLAAGCTDKTARVWDLDSGKELFELHDHASYVFSVAFSPPCPDDARGGRFLASGSVDGTAKIWDLLDSGKLVLTLLNPSSSEYARSHNGLSSVYSLAFSPDGKKLATGSEDGTAKIWDLNTGKATLTLQGRMSAVKSVAFSPDGKILATGGDDEIVNLWDLSGGQVIRTLAWHNSLVQSIAFSPDGKRLATGAGDGTAKIWDLDNGKVILSFDPNKGLVYSVAFSPDGKRLATGSQGGSVKIWDLDKGKEAFTFEGNSSSHLSVFFSPDGKRLATGFDNGVIWELDADEMIRKLYNSRHLATLTQPQLDAYDLEDLLTLKTENETQLCRTNEVWQIAAFADLAFQNSRTSQDLSRTAGDYARAARLYLYALEQGRDSTLLFWLGELYARQTNDILVSTRPDTALQYALLAYQLLPQHLYENRLLLARARLSAPAGKGIETEKNPDVLRTAAKYLMEQKKWRQAKQLYEKAETLEHDPKVLLHLYEIADSMGQVFDFQRILSTNKPGELMIYAGYFFDQKKWDEAAQLYEKAERLEHYPINLISLYEIADSSGQTFDFQRLLGSDQSKDLREYAEYFRLIELFEEARQLYEKTEALEHQSENLLALYQIVSNLDQSFDFQRFLNINDADELNVYAEYFLEDLKWREAGQLYEKSEKLKHRPENLLRLYELADSTGKPFDFQRFLNHTTTGDLKIYAAYFAEKGNQETLENITPLRHSLMFGKRLLEKEDTPENRELTAMYYNNLVWNLLFTGGAAEAEQLIRQGLALDPKNKNLLHNLPHTLLIQGKTKEAIELYWFIAGEPFKEYYSLTHRDVFLKDFLLFESAGLEITGLEEAKKALEEGRK